MADVLDAGIVIVVIELTPHGIAHDYAVAATREGSDQAPLQVRPLRQVQILAVQETPMERARGLFALGIKDCRRQQPVRLEPPLLDPGRPEPGVDVIARIRDEPRYRNLLQADVPLLGGRPPARAGERCRMATLRLDLEIRDRAVGAERRNGFLDPVKVVEVVRVIGCHRVGVKDEIRPSGPQRGEDSPGGVATALRRDEGRSVRIEAEDHERAQRLHRLHVVRQALSAAGERPDIGVERIIFETAGRGGRPEGVNPYFVGVVRGIERHLVPREGRGPEPGKDDGRERHAGHGRSRKAVRTRAAAGV